MPDPITPAWLVIALAITLLSTPSLSAQPAPKQVDSVLSAEEKRAGWLLLLDGKTLNSWMTSAGLPSKTPVEDGCLNPHECGDYMLVHTQQWSNFELKLDFKISQGCNSGIFVRTSPLKPRPGKDVGNIKLRPL